jgi:hypothetical protein
MQAIGDLTTRMAEIENLLLAHVSHSEDLGDQQAIPQYIEARNNYVKRAELIDYYLGKGDIQEAEHQISILKNELPTMKIEAINHELEDFITLKEYLIANLNDANTLNVELTEENITFLLEARDTYQGRASYQAGNILCFYANICVDEDPLNLALIGRNPVNEVQSEEAFEIIENQGDFILYPNPNEGSFVIKGIQNTEINHIEIQDIQGKIMNFETLKINEETAQINFNTAIRGIYIVRIWKTTGEIQNIRILKN